MPRRPLAIGLLSLGLAAPAGLAAPQPVDSPQAAVDAIKRVLNRTMKPCHTDWARIDAVGSAGSWKVDVRIRGSRAGKGVARFRIGKGWPVATNVLARTLAKGCPEA